jgi:hypothetical protein
LFSFGLSIKWFINPSLNDVKDLSKLDELIIPLSFVIESLIGLVRYLARRTLE